MTNSALVCNFYSKKHFLGRIKAGLDADNACKRCGGLVFEAEKMASSGGVYHDSCYNCKICRKTLDYSNSVEFQVRVLYDNIHEVWGVQVKRLTKI